jgi:hypothetical protein
MAGEFKTQGTQVFFVDNSTDSDGVVRYVNCVTAGQDGGGPKDQIEVTCFEDLIDKAFVGGLGNPGTWTFPFVVKKESTSQESLEALKASGDVVDWFVGFSDSADAPTVAANGDLSLPAARSGLQFRAYVSDVTYNGETNDVWRGTLSLQRSGPQRLVKGV